MGFTAERAGKLCVYLYHPAQDLSLTGSYDDSRHIWASLQIVKRKCFGAHAERWPTTHLHEILLDDARGRDDEGDDASGDDLWPGQVPERAQSFGPLAVGQERMYIVRGGSITGLLS